MWTVEVWQRPLRQDDRVIRKGCWKASGKIPSFEEALKEVCRLGEQGIAQAMRDGPEEGPRTIRAYYRRGWWYATGSGGLVCRTIP